MMDRQIAVLEQRWDAAMAEVCRQDEVIAALLEAAKDMVANLPDCALGWGDGGGHVIRYWRNKLQAAIALAEGAGDDD